MPDESWASWADCLPMIQPTSPANCSFVCGPVERTTAHHVPQSSVRGSNPFGASRVHDTHVGRSGYGSSTTALEPEDVEPRRCEAWLAAQCSFESGEMCERRVVHARNRSSEGSRAVSGRPRYWSCSHSRPDRAGNHDPVAPVTGHPPPQTTPTTPLYGPCLPMWPSPRRLWPPSRSMCPYWGAWTPRFRTGECRCKNLQRGRGPSAHQRIRPGLGHSHSNAGDSR